MPLVTTLLNASDLLAASRTDGISVHASFPVSRYDLWSFVEAPAGGGLSVAVPFGTVESVALFVPLLGAYVVVSGALSAGYFGAIAEGITTGRFDFVAGVRRFGVRMVLLKAIVIIGLAAVFISLLVVPPLFVAAVLASLVLAYLYFPTVYVLTLRTAGSSPRPAGRANSPLATGRSGSSSASWPARRSVPFHWAS